LQLLTSKVHVIRIKCYHRLNHCNLLFLLSINLLTFLSISFFLFHLYFDYFCGSLTFVSWWIFNDVSGKFMLVIELSNKWTWITLSIYLLSVDSHVHFWQFAFGTANIFFNKLVQYFSQILFRKISIDDVIGIVFATSFFKGSLRCLFKTKPFQYILFISSQMFGDLSKVDNVGFNSVTFALNFGLHLWHTVSIFRVVNSRWDIQHMVYLSSFK